MSATSSDHVTTLHTTRPAWVRRNPRRDRAAGHPRRGGRAVRARDQAGFTAGGRRRGDGRRPSTKADRPDEMARFTAAAAASWRPGCATRAAQRDRVPRRRSLRRPRPCSRRTEPWIGGHAEKRDRGGQPRRPGGGGGRSSKFATHVYSSCRWPDGRARDRPSRHPRPGHRRTRRPSGTRRAGPRGAVDPVRRGPCTRRHGRSGCFVGRRHWPPRSAVRPAHTAIIARQLGIPCVVAVDGLDAVPVGHAWSWSTAALGTVTVSPDEAGGHARRRRWPAVRPISRRAGTGPGATSDGHVVAILANVQDGAAARAARETPAEGVGLFRTELCFLNRDDRAVRRRAGEDLRRGASTPSPDTKVVIRTLDAGSDKPLKFVGHPGRGQPCARGSRHPHRRRQPRDPDQTAGGHRCGGQERPASAAVGDGHR